MSTVAMIPQSSSTSTVSKLLALNAVRGAELAGKPGMPEDGTTMGNISRPALWRPGHLTNLPQDGTTTGDISRLEMLIPRRPEEKTSWHLEEGMDGMQAAVNRMKRVARGIDSQVRFSKPVVERIDDDEGEKMAFVEIDVLIPEKLDGVAFRDNLFPRLVQVLAPRDQARLAVGVRRLGPRP